MLSEMSAVAFSLLQQHANFVQHPDVVEDYFMFVSGLCDTLVTPVSPSFCSLRNI